MKPLILCIVLMVVTACASGDPKPRAVRAAMTADASMPQTASQVPTSSAVAPPPTETASASGTTALPPTQEAAASTVTEAPPASPTMPSNPPMPQLGTPPPTSSSTPPQPVATATTGEGDRQPPPAKPPTGPTVSFFDSNNFDKRLSSTLRRGSEAVVVTFEASSSVNAIPERLNKWLSAVEKYDGTVQFQPDPDYPALATRGLPGLESLVIGAFTLLYDAIANKILYGPVKGYDTTVYYIKGSGTMTKIVFTHKPQQS